MAVGQEIKVLDHGFVRLVDSMGDDARIVQAARVSYGPGTKTVREDKGLISYLYRHAHTSPFEQVNFTYHAKMPIFVARQWVRHRTAKLNEISGRYSVMKDEFYVPEEGRIQKQAVRNKQGSAPELIEDPNSARALMRSEQATLYGNYEDYLEQGMAKELARINLPLSLYTEWYWTIDLNNLFKLLWLRIDPHAQWEIRQYAQAHYDLIKDIVPYACEAFEEFGLGGKRLGATEWDFVRQFLTLDDESGFKEAAAEHFGDQKGLMNEFLAKVGL